MAEEKKYTGYGYHGGGRPKAEVPIKKFSISASIIDYDLIKAEAEKQGMSISKYLILTALEKIKNN
nr:hypothetical protein [Treponema sp.]